MFQRVNGADISKLKSIIKGEFIDFSTNLKQILRWVKLNGT